jgi:hypothetical protein
VKKYAGKLNVISYDKKEVEVVLVPVNGAIEFGRSCDLSP